MRCYANFFLIQLANALSEEKNLQDIVLDLIETKDDDIKVEASAHDFADNFAKLANKWAKRLSLLKMLILIVRQYHQA